MTANPWYSSTSVRSFALAAVSYLTDFLRAGHPSFASPIAHTWSLAVEEHFYMLWPLALLGLSYLPKRLLLPVLLVVRLFVIAPEERYLRRRFGAEYEAYMGRVRRWV